MNPDILVKLAAISAMSLQMGQELEQLKGMIEAIQPSPDPVPVPSEGGDKIFSQADVDAMLAPMNEKISAMASEIESAKGELEVLKNNMDGKVAEQLAAFKQKAKEAYEAQQASESEGEKSFSEIFN